MTAVKMELRACQVRSRTDRPCPRPAAVKMQEVPFCEPCAREQEAYFAIGKLTEISRCVGNDGALAEALARARRNQHGREDPAARPASGATAGLHLPEIAGQGKTVGKEKTVDVVWKGT